MTKKAVSRNMVLATAAASLFLAGAMPSTANAAQGDKVRCYGANSCKGTGACGGVGHSCAGHNECKGKGYLKLDKEACLEQGGRLTPEPPGNEPKS